MLYISINSIKEELHKTVAMFTTRLHENCCKTTRTQDSGTI